MINKQDSEFDEFDDPTAEERMTLEGMIDEKSMDGDVHYKKLFNDFFPNPNMDQYSELTLDEKKNAIRHPDTQQNKEAYSKPTLK